MEITKSNVKSLTNSLFNDLFDVDNFFSPDRLMRSITKTIPAANIIENAKDYSIELAAPGLDKGNFNVNIEDNILSVSAEKKEEKNEEKENYTRNEFRYDSFLRSFRLPTNVDAQKVSAKYENGLLMVSLPKLNDGKSASSKEIKIH